MSKFTPRARGRVQRMASAIRSGPHRISHRLELAAYRGQLGPTSELELHDFLPRH